MTVVGDADDDIFMPVDEILKTVQITQCGERDAYAGEYLIPDFGCIRVCC